MNNRWCFEKGVLGVSRALELGRMVEGIVLGDRVVEVRYLITVLRFLCFRFVVFSYNRERFFWQSLVICCDMFLSMYRSKYGILCMCEVFFLDRCAAI
jgi:hypothetical protein